MANAILEKIDKARKEKTDFDIKAIAKELSFHLGGIRLHGLFWQNLAPAGKGGGGLPKGDLAKVIDEEYGGFDRFKKGVLHGSNERGGLRLGCTQLLQQDGKAADYAGREA